MESNVIDHFDGEYFFLSNFYPSPITYNGIVYPTNEHFFQAMKTCDYEMRKQIAACENPGKAKRMGRRVKLRNAWDAYRDNYMFRGLILKFEDPSLRQKLLDTGNSILIEGNTWNDTYWGVCNGVGENHLGKLLMRLRDVLRNQDLTK